MKYKLALALAVLYSCALARAQEKGNVIYQSAGAVGMVGGGMLSTTPIQGAPYSATLTNESIQTLADGNRIVQTSSGTTARDAQGRTRQDTVLPAIGNLSPANAPHFIFIQDPVAQISYTLNLTDKTAQKMPMLPPPPGPFGGSAGPGVNGASVTIMKMGTGSTASISATGPGPMSITSGSLPPPTVGFQKVLSADFDLPATTEDLGPQTIEGIITNGVRTTRTIPAGQMGNEKPISIVTEVWTSPDLKTIVYSKRTDPRMGEQTFQLTNIVRAEPDPSLFTIPADFKIVEGPQSIVYRLQQ
jgi:hypothetical protein